MLPSQLAHQPRLLLLHGGSIVLQEIKRAKRPADLEEVEVPRLLLLRCGLGFFQTAALQCVFNSNNENVAISRTQLQGLLGYCGNPLVVAEQFVDDGQIPERKYVAGGELGPQLINFSSCLKISLDDIRVVRRNVEPLALAPPLAQIVGLLKVFDRPAGFPAEVKRSQSRVSHRKIWVEVDGSLEQRKRAWTVVLYEPRLVAKALSL